MKLSPWEPDLRTLIARLKDGEIDLQPNFQRGDIWPLPKKKRLIDTVLRGWSIPPIHVVITATGTMEVLDGQQRLTSFRDFERNDFKIDGSIEPEDPQIVALSGLRYSQLPSEIRRAFDLYTLRVFRITDCKPEEPGELFYRLNQPLSLTAGEQRNALYGPARAQLKDLVVQFEEQGNQRDTIGFSNVRMSYDDVFAKLMYFLEKKSFGIRAAEAAISDRFKVTRPFGDDIIECAFAVIRTFSAARERANRVKLNKATLLSWFLFFARAPEHHTALAYLGEFEAARLSYSGKAHADDQLALRDNGLRTFRRGDDYIRMYVNRASLRVSDVSSVVYRDFALWAVYVLNGRPAPPSVRVNDIRRVENLLDERTDIGAELTLEQTLDPQLWATLP